MLWQKWKLIFFKKTQHYNPKILINIMKNRKKTNVLTAWKMRAVHEFMSFFYYNWVMKVVRIIFNVILVSVPYFSTSRTALWIGSLLSVSIILSTRFLSFFESSWLFLWLSTGLSLNASLWISVTGWLQLYNISKIIAATNCKNFKDFSLGWYSLLR
jgi:hypothetical protein